MRALEDEIRIWFSKLPNMLYRCLLIFIFKFSKVYVLYVLDVFDNKFYPAIAEFHILNVEIYSNV